MQNCYVKSKKSLDGNNDDQSTTSEALSFVKEIVNENRELKLKLQQLKDQADFSCKNCANKDIVMQERLQELQTCLLSRTEKATKLLTEKHQQELMKKIEENIDAEKKWYLEKEELLQKIRNLTQENAILQHQNVTQTSNQHMSKGLEGKLLALEKEFSHLHKDMLKLGTERDNQLIEIQRLRQVDGHNADLIEEVKEVKQQNEELFIRNKRLQEDIKNFCRSERDEEIMASLRVRLRNLHKEKSLFSEKETDMERQIQDLKEENSKLRRALVDSERMRQEAGDRITQLLSQLEQFKMQMSLTGKDKAFQEFVQVKREYLKLRDENEELKIMLKFGPSNKKLKTFPKIESPDNKNSGMIPSITNKNNRETMPLINNPSSQNKEQMPAFSFPTQK